MRYSISTKYDTRYDNEVCKDNLNYIKIIFSFYNYKLLCNTIFLKYFENINILCNPSVNCIFITIAIIGYLA